MLLRESKDKPQTERKYLQNTCLIKYLYPKYNKELLTLTSSKTNYPI